MRDEQRDPEVSRRLEEEDPLDRIGPDDGDEEDVERAWEETETESGEAPTG